MIARKQIKALSSLIEERALFVIVELVIYSGPHDLLHYPKGLPSKLKTAGECRLP